MRSAGLLIALLLAVVPLARAQEVSCENERGEYFTMSLGEYRSDLRPYGPCNEVGTYERLHRNDKRPAQQRLAARDPEYARELRCKDCVFGRGGCKGLETAKCEDFEWAASICNDCRTGGRGCGAAELLSCKHLPRTEAEQEALAARRSAELDARSREYQDSARRAAERGMRPLSRDYP